MSATPETTSAVSYHCPHCKASIEVRSGRADAWLKCPQCGRASRSPELPLLKTLVIEAEPRPAVAPASISYVDFQSRFMVPREPVAREKNWNRIILGVLFYASVVTTLFSTVNVNAQEIAVGSGIVGFVFLLLLFRAAMSRPTTSS